MERYGGIPAMGSVPVDPVSGWTAPGGETSLEEPMWQLGLGGGPDAYPERPNEPDCIYYLRNGVCGYGDRCRFNHPRDRGGAMGALRSSGIEYPERAGQTVCQYYMRTGMCKFGSSCKYHHPKHGVGSSAPAAMNRYGYPLRPGEKECSYYVKTGQCKFGAICKFHHPDPSSVQLPPVPQSPTVPTPAVYPIPQPSVQSSPQYGIFPGNWPVARPPMIPGNYVPGNYGPPMILPHGMVPIPGWNPYLAPGVSPSTPPPVGAGPVYGYTHLSPYLPVTSSVGPSSSGQKEHSFPDRPGQPECQYYMRTGDCKFGPTCKYHHPQSNLVLGPMGLPLRPGAPICSHYAQNGMCKFGPSCKFDHPMRPLSYNTSASSLTDMHVAPYPVGSAIATLAPSYSSSNLRQEQSQRFGRDTFSSQSASIGSIYSKSEPAPQSSVHQSGSTSSTGGKNNQAE